MPKKASKNPADYIVSLNMNGLKGRMLRLPSKPTKQSTGKEILFIYGHHSSLERWWGIAQVMNRYGAVTMPDLPGFGGMDSFYRIGRKPTLDNMADYLAAFIKMRYRRKKVAIVGMSYGFVVVTRMLQRYPELCGKVTLLVSIVGFAHRDDFIFTKPRYHAYLSGSKLLSHWVPASLFRYGPLNAWVLRSFYEYTHNAKKKFALAKDSAELEHLKDVEVGLWHDNDVRTWAFTTSDFLTLDNCQVRVDLPLWHMMAKTDNYFDHRIVEQHLKVIFSGFDSDEFDLGAHSPSILADEKEALALFPPKLRQALGRLK
jgi:pimeloyl-ACP methyl ester carboxylesterase